MPNLPAALRALIVAAGSLAATALAQTNAGPRIVCDEPSFQFGEKRDTEVVEHRYVVRNAGTAPLLISRVHASCGCTVASMSNQNLAAGQSASVDARFNLTGRSGPQHKTIYIESNDPATPRLELTIQGTIVQDLALEPRFLNLGQITRDTVSTGAVQLISRLPNVHITTATCDNAGFKVATRPDRTGFTVTTVPPLQPGPVRAGVNVSTDHPSGASLQFYVLAVVLGEVAIIPQELILRGAMTNATSRTVLLRPGTVRSFEVTGVQPPAPGILVVTNKLADGTWTITLNGLTAAPEMAARPVRIATTIPTMPEVFIPVRILP